MFEGKTVAVVVPCYNEQQQVARVLETMPDFVDCVLVVDDASTDGTVEVVRRHAEAAAGRIVLIEQQPNQGVGRAIVTGYQEAVRRQMDVTAVMAGDAQMDPKQLRLLLRPVAAGEADYAKGNRLFYRRAWHIIPRHRYLGNAFLSMLTKIASGYWHVADSQTGYTAISLEALETIDLEGVYPRYGYPNDLLVRLNADDFRVADVPIWPTYNVGEQSKMKLWKLIPKMSWLILKMFFWRMWRKYVIRDFHPLVFFYLAAIVTGLMGVLFFLRMVCVWAATGSIPPVNTLVWALCFISSTQFALFGMWFDLEMNRLLNANPPRGKVDRTPQRRGPGAPEGPEEPAAL